MTHTRIHLAEPFSDQLTPVSLFADKVGKPVVTMEIGDTASRFSLGLSPAAARKLGFYLIAFADTADEIGHPDVMFVDTEVA